MISIEEHDVADLLIRNVPDDVVAGVDRNAKRLGISRNEYVRRALARDQDAEGEPVTADDLVALSVAFADLADAEVMRSAWE